MFHKKMKKKKDVNGALVIIILILAIVILILGSTFSNLNEEEILIRSPDGLEIKSGIALSPDYKGVASDSQCDYPYLVDPEYGWFGGKWQRTWLNDPEDCRNTQCDGSPCWDSDGDNCYDACLAPFL